MEERSECLKRLGLRGLGSPPLHLRLNIIPLIGRTKAVRTNDIGAIVACGVPIKLRYFSFCKKKETGVGK